MIRTLWLSVLLASSSILASTVSVRVAPMESYRETDSLPPQLSILVTAHCYEKVLRGLREDVPAADGSVLIATGALILRDLANPCSQGPRTIVVPLGSTFSGRPYEIVPISAR
jgi:hypothetical protein